MSETFSFLSGSLALENKSFHVQAPDVICGVYAHHNGYVGYKLATLGTTDPITAPAHSVFGNFAIARVQQGWGQPRARVYPAWH